MNNEVREQLSEYAHNTWSGWMEYMFSKCELVNGGILIPSSFYDRWSRQKNTKYSDLSEEEKKSDRDEADKIIEILENNFDYFE